MSFGFIGSWFSYYWGSSRTDQPEVDEFTILLDSAVLSSPCQLSEGFDLFIRTASKDETRIGEHITHLSELDLDVEYYTQKGTRVIRTSQSEVTLGDCISLPILKRGETYETTRNLTQYCMKGFLSPEALVVAIENFSGSRIQDEGLLFYENGNNRLVFLTADLQNLQEEISYVSPNGSMVLKKHSESDRIEFSFGRNLHNPQATKKPTVTLSTSRSAKKKGRKGINRAVTPNPNLLQTLSAHTPPQSPRMVTRRPKKRLLDAHNGTVYDITQTPPSDKKRKMIEREVSWAGTPSAAYCVEKEMVVTEGFAPPPSVPSAPIQNPATPTPMPAPAPAAAPAAVPAASIPVPPPPPKVVPKPPPAPKAPKAPTAPAPPSAPTPQSANRRRLRPLHWKAIPKSKAETSFWGKLDDISLGVSLDAEPDAEQMDIQNSNTSDGQEPKNSVPINLGKEVDGIFSISPDKTQKSPPKGLQLKAKKRTHLLDVKRSNNVGILLSQFKMSFAEIKQSLLEFDNSLTSEHLMSLKYMFPLSDQEKKAFKEYEGPIEDLATPEQFYKELLSVPRLEQKINFFLFKKQFEEHIEALNQTASILSLASNELQNSAQFAKLLKWIYTIGSYLNRDTRLSEAAGFSLESLPKIIETKTGQANVTFIDFLVSKVVASTPEIVHFEEELPNLDLASKVSLETLGNHKKETENEINELRKEIFIYEQSPLLFSKEDRFLAIMKPFLSSAEATFDLTATAIANSISSFNRVVEYFGDDSKTTTPASFFQNVVLFANAFRRAHHNHMDKLKKMERLRELKNATNGKVESPLAQKALTPNPKLLRRHTIVIDKRAYHSDNENEENLQPSPFPSPSPSNQIPLTNQ